VFPLLEATRDTPQVFVNACDYSSSAINILKSQSAYTEYSERTYAFVFDLGSPHIPEELEEGSRDIIPCVFVLSGMFLIPLRVQHYILINGNNLSRICIAS
jgi:tRNAThr (cytosine32-N3)-methyltransferase